MVFVCVCVMKDGGKHKQKVDECLICSQRWERWRTEEQSCWIFYYNLVWLFVFSSVTHDGRQLRPRVAASPMTEEKRQTADPYLQYAHQNMKNINKVINRRIVANMFVNHLTVPASHSQRLAALHFSEWTLMRSQQSRFTVSGIFNPNCSSINQQTHLVLDSTFRLIQIWSKSQCDQMHIQIARSCKVIIQHKKHRDEEVRRPSTQICFSWGQTNTRHIVMSCSYKNDHSRWSWIISRQ